MDVIRSERLDLVSITRDRLADIVEGRVGEVAGGLGIELPAGWMADRMLPRWRLQQIEAEPASEPWLLRAVLLREPRTYVGYFNFHGPPTDEGWVELGYEIEPNHRRRGYAQEAVLRMMRWALEEHRIDLFRASIGPDNQPSLRMIEKLGFEQVGSQIDEIDGLELVFMRRGIPEI